jgi:hypothetical protein
VSTLSAAIFNRLAPLGAIAVIALGTSGCGLHVTSPDLFVLTRNGQGQRLTLVVNDGGTIRCNGGRARPIGDPLLLKARSLVTKLDSDAKAQLRVPGGARTVYSYSIEMQTGTVTFADSAAVAHPELGPAEEFAIEAERGPCAGR